MVAFIDERNTIVGAPFMKAEHYPVFDCAIGDRAIHYMGHVKMMGAVQPFISGAISKTVNLPETATVDDVSGLLADAWKLGVKAIAIYRDNCKVAQPLSKKGERGGRGASARSEGGAPAPARRPHRDRPQVQGRRLRGLHPRRPLRRRDARRHLRRHRQGGHDPGRPHELVHDLGLARAPVRRAARGLRLQVRAHALRAVGDRRTTPTSASPSRSSTTSSAGWGSASSTPTSSRARDHEPRGQGAPRAGPLGAGGERRPRPTPTTRPPHRQARRPSSTPGRTRSSAPSAAAAWCGRAAATPAATAARTPGVASRRHAHPPHVWGDRR